MLFSLGTSRTLAQQPPAGGIAVIDVSKIYKNHARFKEMMTGMEREIQQAEESVRKDKDAIKQLGERLEGYHPGTAEYKQLEEELANRSSQLNVRIQLQKKDFLQKQAKIHYSVYREITQEVERYAAATGTVLVLRFNGDEVNLEKPDDVLRQINQQVVWYTHDRDITDLILGQLNRPGLNPADAGGPPGNPNASRMGVPLPPAGAARPALAAPIFSLRRTGPAAPRRRSGLPDDRPRCWLFSPLLGPVSQDAHAT